VSAREDTLDAPLVDLDALDPNAREEIAMIPSCFEDTNPEPSAVAVRSGGQRSG